MTKWRKGDRLHHDDGSHRASARSARGSEVDWFEANAQRHFQNGPCALDEAARSSKPAEGERS